MASCVWYSLFGAALLAYIYQRSGQKASLVVTSIQERYDYIIVGGGTAGSVLAARLSEDPDRTVLVLEAGQDDDSYPEIPVPGMSLPLWTSSAVWDDYAEPQAEACKGMINNRCRWAHGKVLGGGSSINFMMYVRGSPHDYDSWEQKGCTGWAYKDVLPYFKKAETFKFEESPDWDYHGDSGPIVIEDTLETPLADLYVKAAQELGYDATDYNGAKQEGFSKQQQNIGKGVRMSAAIAYLKPAMARPNLHVATSAIVHKVLFKGKQATGVEFLWNGKVRQVSAGKEVILSAGALDSPKILMLSGVGPKDHLKSHKIPVVADLPVGDNLQDHVMIEALMNTIQEPISVTPAKATSLWSSLKYRLTGKGALGSGGCYASGFMRSKHQPKDDPMPYIQLAACILPGNDDYSKDKWFATYNFRPELVQLQYGHLDNTEGFVAGVLLNHPMSVGSVRLRSNKPSDRPIFTANYLQHQQDVDILIESVRIAQKISNTTVMRNIGTEMPKRNHPYCSHHKYDSDAFWECIVRHDTKTVFHFSGTCKMGALNDPTAVVDPKLRVRGLERLRVVDTSIMPHVTAGNTMAPTIMIAERAADIIKSDA